MFNFVTFCSSVYCVFRSGTGVSFYVYVPFSVFHVKMCSVIVMMYMTTADREAGHFQTTLTEVFRDFPQL